MVVKLQTNNRNVPVVSAYASQLGLDHDEKDGFHENVTQLIASIYEKDMVIIGGDLNRHNGK